MIVETFENIEPYPTILRVDTTKKEQKIKIPPFLPVIKEVTGDSQFTTDWIASIDYQMSLSDQDTIKT